MRLLASGNAGGIGLIFTNQNTGRIDDSGVNSDRAIHAFGHKSPASASAILSTVFFIPRSLLAGAVFSAVISFKEILESKE